MILYLWCIVKLY